MYTTKIERRRRDMFKDTLLTIGAYKGKLDSRMLDESGAIHPIWYMTQEFSRLGDNVIKQEKAINILRIIFEDTGVYVEIRGFDAIKNLYKIQCFCNRIQIDSMDSIHNMVHVVIDNTGKVTKLKHKGKKLV